MGQRGDLLAKRTAQIKTFGRTNSETTELNERGSSN